MKPTKKPSLVFTSGSAPLEWLTRVTTLSSASHVAIAIDDNLIHAYELGVIEEPRSKWFERDQKLIAEYEIIPDVSDMIPVVRAQVGQSYDVIGAALVVLRRAFRQAKSDALIAHGRSPHNTCAGFVMQLDPKGEHIPEWNKIARDLVTPADLLRACQYGLSFERIG